MALLNKLFSSKKKNHRSHFVLFGKNETESWIPFDFNPEQVRVLLFRECESSRRRKILFDSCSIQKVALDKSTCGNRHSSRFGAIHKTETKKTDSVFLEVTNGYGYKYTRPSEETNLVTISDMIFGTVPLTFQGTSMKVHSLKSPARLMCTKVFPSPSTGHGQRVSEHSLDDSVGGCSSISSLGEAVDAAMLSESGTSSLGEVELGRASLEKRASEEDSGFCGDASLRSISLGSSSNPWLLGEQTASFDSRESSYSSIGSWLPNHSSGSMSSLQRRWCRHLSTSMELFPSQCKAFTSSGRRSKLGLAVMLQLSQNITTEVQEQAFFFDHISVVESIVNRLRGMVEKAYSRRDMFHHLLKEGTDELKQSMVDLFSAPRLPQPVWLGLVSSPSTSAQSTLANTFLGELCNLLASLDTKSANFFVSTLVTSVLTHHLGWVPTVLPGTSPPLSSHTDKSTNQMLDSLAKSHPYNALWAQMGDLQGALGHPLRVSRTIITGRRAELLDQLVRVLSYFIRCGAIKQLHEERLAKDIEDHRLLMPVLSPYHDRSLSLSHMKSSVSLSTLTSKNMDSSSTTLVPLAETSSKSLGMHRTSSCLTRLVSEQDNNIKESPSSSSLYPSLSVDHSDIDLITEKVTKMCRVPTEAIMCHLKSLVSETRSIINSERQMAAIDKGKTNVPLFTDDIKVGTEQAEDVIFVLGENEKLVGIKHNNKDTLDSGESQIAIENSSENIRETSLYLKSYHSVRFHAERCDEGEDCCLMLGGVKEEVDEETDILEIPQLTLDTDSEDDLDDRGPQLVELPLPVSQSTKPASSANKFAASLLGCASEHYIADFVVQACTQDTSIWKHKLRRDLALAAHQPMFDKEVAEAVCVVANTDTWEVQVVSSHTYVVDQPGTLGVRQGMSQLVANMLESVQHLWKLHTPPEHCLQHLESKLREICLHSHALAQLLLATDCCEMQQLTSALNLEANDVPLLLAVASTHSPQVTQRYGLSFR